LKLPTFLAKKIAGCDVEAAVTAALTRFRPWIESNKTVFFPEYTDHGPSHIEAVWNTAVGLIRKEARDVFTGEDASVLALAILVHDAGMHLTKDGFRWLVSKGIEWKVPDFDDESWPELWRAYCCEARRFDEGKVLSLLGDDADSAISTDDLSLADIGERTTLLAGEFLRRHHHRLAHEIAIFGVPGGDIKPLTTGVDDQYQFVADLSGLIARSHGMPIRWCFKYLRERYYGITQIKGVHPVFLMTLVRVADYLQIEADRAPSQLLHVQRLRSPISRREWDSHNAVNDIRPGKDPEAVFVSTDPQNVATYLRLKSLLTDLQQELDTSWAVLGEVYGRYNDQKWNLLGLSIRRITSNLDDEEQWAKRSPFVPIHARFDTSTGGELMKLLVHPLYGDFPQIGIRELIQNAVDATRELDYIKKNKKISDEDRATLAENADVLVTLDTQCNTLTVEDRGIGMDVATIRDYFLKAGASLRKSQAWAQDFMDDDQQPKVLRSGRFGIGVFATFLLGDEISVETRHYQQERGIMFQAGLSTQYIEMKYCDRTIGTKIKINLRKGVVEKLAGQGYSARSWDWYVLDYPKVCRRIIPQPGTLQQQTHLPGRSATLPRDMHRISHSEYDDIHWTYQHVPQLSVNGLIVGKSPEPEARFIDLPGDFECIGSPSVTRPSLSIFDPKGNIPVNVQRTGVINNEFSFDEMLLCDINSDIIAFLLTRKISPVFSISKYHALLHPGWKLRDNRPQILLSNNGVLPLDSWHIDSTEISRIMVINVDGVLRKDQILESCSIAPVCTGVSWVDITANWDDGFYESFSIRLAHFLEDINKKISSHNTKGIRIIIDTIITENDLFPESQGYFDGDEIAVYLESYYDMNVVYFKRKNIHAWNVGSCPDTNGIGEAMISEITTKGASDYPMCVELFLDRQLDLFLDKQPERPISQLARIWQEYLNQPYIPFDKEQHKNLVSYARKRGLGAHIDKWLDIEVKC
jgi:hypothetical protein